MNNKGLSFLTILIPLGVVLLLGVSGFSIFYISKNNKILPKIEKEVTKPLVNIENTEPSQTSSEITPLPSSIISVTSPTVISTSLPKVIITPRPCTYSYDSIFGERKCFTYNDYNQITFLEIEYQGTKNQLEGAKDRKDLTCDGSEFFRSSCNEAKEDIKDLTNDLKKIENEAKAIISRGWVN